MFNFSFSFFLFIKNFKADFFILLCCKLQFRYELSNTKREKKNILIKFCYWIHQLWTSIFGTSLVKKFFFLWLEKRKRIWINLTNISYTLIQDVDSHWSSSTTSKHLKWVISTKNVGKWSSVTHSFREKLQWYGNDFYLF